MSVIIILIAASITVAGGFLLAFLWSVRTGQFDDDFTPSIRILFDDHIRGRTSDPGNQSGNQTTPLCQPNNSTTTTEPSETSLTLP